MVITVSDVIARDGIKEYAVSGHEHYFECPVCHRRSRKCSYNPTKGKVRDGIPSGVWRCFHCDSKGDGVLLHAAVRLGTTELTDEQYRSVLSDLLGNEGNFVHADYKEEENVPQAKKASDDEIAMAYSTLTSVMSLSTVHRADLTKRGLSDKDIADFHFCDAPSDGRVTASKLIKEGIRLTGVPGFYKNYCGDFTTAGVKRSGYLCPVMKPVEISEQVLEKMLSKHSSLLYTKRDDGRCYVYRMSGFQKRLDAPQDGNKYVWFSSSGRKEGVTSGAPSTCLIGKIPGIVIITEGILKATVTYCLLNRQFTVIGVPGVKNLSSLKSLLDSGLIGKDDLVFEAFDMDKAPLTAAAFMDAYKNREKKHQSKTIDEYRMHLAEKQHGIAEDTKKLCNTVKFSGRMILPLSWNMQDGKWKGIYKGIDDVLLECPGAKQALADYIFYKKARNTSPDRKTA